MLSASSPFRAVKTSNSVARIAAEVSSMSSSSSTTSTRALLPCSTRGDGMATPDSLLFTDDRGSNVFVAIALDADGLRHPLERLRGVGARALRARREDGLDLVRVAHQVLVARALLLEVLDQ